MKLNLKSTKQKGITLIALVITILVLLILAGVSINTVFSDNGIMKRARDSKKVTNISSLKETIGVVLQGRNINKQVGLEQNSLKTDLEKGISGDKQVEQITDDTCSVTRDDVTLTVYDKGDRLEGKIDLWDGTTKNKPTVDKNKNWHIYTPEEMKYFADYVNGNLTEDEKAGLEITDDTIVYLEKDLDLGARQVNGTLTTGTAWEPVGTEKEAKFTGTFEGNNHTIRGVYVKKEGKFAGIFGNSDTIQNLTVSSSYIEAAEPCAGGIVGALREGNLINCHNKGTKVITQKNYVGGIAGQSTGEKIQQCTNSGEITGKIEKDWGLVGGIVGYSSADNAKILNCENSGIINSNGNGTGGIAGAFKGDIEECRNSGIINGGKGSDDQGANGGIVGYGNNIIKCINFGTINVKGNANGGITGASGGTITKCINKGTVNVNGIQNGGIIGNAKETASITKCINMGEIKSTNSSSAQNGGIVGGLNGTVEQCYNSGTVRGITRLGGICGIVCNMYESTIKNCYNTGSIIPEKSSKYPSVNIQCIGGIIGWMSSNETSGTISNNYNIGKIEIAGKEVTYVGGVIGSYSSKFTIKNNYYIEGTSKTNDTLSSSGESKTEAQMKTEEFLALLNADQETAVWELKPNSYPSIIGLSD